MPSHETTLLSDSPDTHPPHQPLRLQLSGAPGQAVLDGAWWPQSRDIDAELADLVDHFPVATGRVARAMVLAADPSNRWSARQVLAVCALDEEQGGSQDHWTDDGGSWWRQEDDPPSYRSGSSR